MDAKRKVRKSTRPKRPTLKTIMRQMNGTGGVSAACEYGCRTDPDGQCPHGKDSWALIMGLI